MDFPTLSRPPADLKGPEFADRSISDEADGGYRFTRPRNTRSIKKWTVTYVEMPDADRALIETFVDSVNKHTQFNWTHPTTAVVHVVRFTELPVPQYEGFGTSSDQGLWTFDFVVETV